MSPTYLTIAEITAEAARCFALVGCPELLQHTRIDFDTRGVKRMGFARKRGGKYQMGFAARIWGSLPVEQRLDTVRHECAHVIDMHQRGTSDHSKHWKRIAKLVGAKPESCAQPEDMGAAARVIHEERMKRGGGAVPVHCGCDFITEVTAKMGARMAMGAHYFCKRCKQTIRLGKRPVAAPVAPAPAAPVVAAKPTLLEQATARCAKVGCTITPKGRDLLRDLAWTHYGQTLKIQIPVVSTTMPSAGEFTVEFTLEIR